MGSAYSNCLIKCLVVIIVKFYAYQQYTQKFQVI